MATDEWKYTFLMYHPDPGFGDLGSRIAIALVIVPPHSVTPIVCIEEDLMALVPTFGRSTDLPEVMLVTKALSADRDPGSIYRLIESMTSVQLILQFSKPKTISASSLDELKAKLGFPRPRSLG